MEVTVSHLYEERMSPRKMARNDPLVSRYGFHIASPFKAYSESQLVVDQLSNPPHVSPFSVGSSTKRVRFCRPMSLHRLAQGSNDLRCESNPEWTMSTGAETVERSCSAPC